MKRFKIHILFLYGILAFPLGVTAKNAFDSESAFVDFVVNVMDEHADTSRMQTVRIYYKVNRTAIVPDYMDNRQALGTLDRIFTEHSAEDIAYIVITGSASPEGPPRNNDRLAQERTLSLKNYILANYPDLHDDQIVTIPLGEDWDGLESRIEDDANVPYKDELLRILRSGLSREEQKRRMAALGGGQAYKYLQSYILPQLRGGVSSMIYFRDRPVTIIDTVEIVRVDTVTVYVPQVRQRKPFLIAVKTNLLYDAVLLPNLSVEVPFGRDYKWSASIEGDWSWWDTGAGRYNYHRIQMAGIEVRRWFCGCNPLNGWYAGVYGYGGNYDLRLFAKNNSDAGQQSLWSYSAGVTLGYSMPIGRRFNLEFGLGAGYLGGEYKKYDVSNCAEGVFPILGAYRRNYFGITKAGVSLVWLIGNGVNAKDRKGVERW